ncbi:PAS domain-containing sensor histidine kinase [Solimicrobium silvestre]|uniref:histidine kinase n=1 Tax=Solimicrobium silvestre TaxID=2099400 RepID=A0A2S9GSD1_9BURK|nr:ATP-binding protein [Solimicrobium silvestre]PRC90598.1 PAS domain S-box protein [Solimicrobium silvestre]
MPTDSNPAPGKLNAGLLKKMIDHSREAVMVVDAATLTLLNVNLNACQMLGFLPEELLGNALSFVECSLLDLFFWEELAQEPLFEGTRIAETEWMRSDGTSFQIEKRIASYAEGDQHFWIIYAEDLTRRKAIEHQQLHLVSQLQSSLESTAEGILAVNLFGHVVNLNRRFALMWNLPEELLLERKENYMWEHIIASLSDGSGLTASLKKAHMEPHIESEDVLALRDGRYFICVSKPEFVRDSLIGRVFSVRDITTMKKIETDLLAARDIAEQASLDKSRMLDALIVSESRMRRLVNSNLIGIMQGDLKGKITEANEVLLRLFGVAREEFNRIGLNWLKLTTPENHKTYEHALNELRMHGQAPPFEVELISKTGAQLPAMVGLAQLEGSHTEWVGFVLDLTKQRESDRIKSDFISMVSHELRTPLTSIHGSLGLVESGVCGEIPLNAMNLVKIALKNSKRLGVLVNDLLDMEKLANGKMVLNSERFNLVALTRQAMEANLGYAQTFNVAFRFDEHPDHAWAMGDTNRLMQVFANLLSNAIKFSKDGDCVEIKVLEGAGVFRVEIKDRGPGIPVAFLDRIFKKFAQADDGDTRRQGGTGLGLNITQNLVEKMGGEIGFESEVGVGSVFWFTVVAGVQRRDDRVRDNEV